ncbi:MAG TPA: P-II family nitrogen regulator [Nitrosopumilaceae archaeon]|nr:P-II family nitrogen regulator [Nitrosopumilaceae archaeon]
MKKIEAIIRDSKFNEVKEVLIKLGVGGMTTYDVKGRGSQIGQSVPPGHPSSVYADDLVPKRKIEIVCIDEEANKIISAISMHAKTDLIGDGKIFVSEISNVIKIRTSEEGQTAV